MKPLMLCSFAFVILVAAAPSGARVFPQAPDVRQAVAPPAYDESADAKADLAKALAQATREHKRVLVVFGGNWCGDCIALNKRLHEEPAVSVMNAGFVLVHVDIGHGAKNKDLVEQCRVTLEKGVPAVAVLESDGTVLYSARNGEFEPARRLGPQVFVDFLNTWKPRAR
jgi:thiol:disulfide interchange protein